jgi:hypothetical protein
LTNPEPGLNMVRPVVQGAAVFGYLNKPVPKTLVARVLALAVRAPTSLNTQRGTSMS